MQRLNYRNAQGMTLEGPSLRDLLTPLFRRQRFLSASFLGLALIAVLASLSASNNYKCRMEILVNRERSDPTVTSQTSQSPVTAPLVTEEEMNSEVELLRSPELLTEVVRVNGLQELEKKSLSALLRPRQQENWYIAKAADHLGKKLAIEVVKKANLIDVSYKSSDPQIAYGVLSKLAALYMEKRLVVQRPIGSYDFFAKETEKYKQALAKSEMNLSSFGTVEGVVAPDVQRTDMAQQLVNTEIALHQAQGAIAADEERIRDEQAQMRLTSSRSATQQVSNTAAVLLQQLEVALLAARTKRDQLAVKYDASYPLVQEADQEIAETQAAIDKAKTTQYLNETTDRDPTYELLREDVSKAQADLAAQKAMSLTLANNIKTIRREMVNLDQKAVKQADLVREAKADEGNYLLYLSKREQERTSDALDQKRIGNVAIAVPPMVPILPAISPLVVLLIGFSLALVLSAGGAFVMDYMDSSFRTPLEVFETLRIPVLASVPKLPAP
jgi:uncharacterized protein involved in exopolysaccharide biosynthesis